MSIEFEAQKLSQAPEGQSAEKRVGAEEIFFGPACYLDMKNSAGTVVNDCNNILEDAIAGLDRGSAKLRNETVNVTKEGQGEPSSSPKSRNGQGFAGELLHGAVAVPSSIAMT